MTETDVGAKLAEFRAAAGALLTTTEALLADLTARAALPGVVAAAPAPTPADFVRQPPADPRYDPAELTTTAPKTWPAQAAVAVLLHSGRRPLSWGVGTGKWCWTLAGGKEPPQAHALPEGVFKHLTGNFYASERDAYLAFVDAFGRVPPAAAIGMLTRAVAKQAGRPKPQPNSQESTCQSR